jgi:GNAT superfamily N-acetyltransferase
MIQWYTGGMTESPEASPARRPPENSRAKRPPFRIRRATVRDAPAILGLMRALAEYEELSHEFHATLSRLRRDGFGRRPRFESLVCWQRRVPVAFALYFFTYSTFAARPTLYLEDLFVRPEHRGRGVGKALLAALARIAVRKGCARMEWTVLKINTPAIRFYHRLGAGLRKEWILTRLTGAPLQKLARDGMTHPRRGRAR